MEKVTILKLVPSNKFALYFWFFAFYYESCRVGGFEENKKLKVLIKDLAEFIGGDSEGYESIVKLADEEITMEFLQSLISKMDEFPLTEEVWKEKLNLITLYQL